MLFDCAIIGGGPAGLSGALILGRARRNVTLFDNNNPNEAGRKLSLNLCRIPLNQSQSQIKINTDS